MPIIEINDVGSIGLIRDTEGYMLPPEAWTFLENARVKDGGIERNLGHSQVFGTLEAGNDSFTKILLHLDGTDTSTTIIDSNAGGSAHTWTASGNAQLDTAQVKFGSTSLLGDGTGDFVSTPDHADFTLGSGDFTVDCWFNNTAASGTNRLLCGQADSALTDSLTSWRISRTSTNEMRGRLCQGGVATIVTSTTQFTNSLNTGWHHIAFVRTGNTLKLFVDGVQEGGDVSFTGSVTDSSENVAVGGIGSSGVEWVGWIDEVRLSVGTARWTANFTPPTRAYFTSAEVAPHFALPIKAATEAVFWPYVSLAKAFVWDGSTHTNITRRSGGVDSNYTTSATREWNGCLFGGIPIFNNGVDIPQYWATPSAGTQLANLPNWDSNHRAKIIRAFQNHLVAFNVTKTGTAFPHMVMWSHPADPGSVPSSWDVTDATKDAGQTDLADVQAGLIREAMGLRGHMYVYKEGSTWRMSYIGGSFIFDFDTFLETSGILAPRCVALTPDGTRHVVATQDDIIVHNGNQAESVLSKRFRRQLFNQIDTNNFLNCFMWTNPLYNEMGFAYPESGMTNPTRALIWNYKEGQLGALTERAVNFRNVATGELENVTEETWASAVGTWDDDNSPWSESQRRRVVALHTDDSKFGMMDSGTDILGVGFTATARRENLAVSGRKRTGEWIVDFTTHKVIRRVWFKMDGNPVTIRIGFQGVANGPITWRPSRTYDPSTQRYIDVVGNGVSMAIEIAGASWWRLNGYAVEGEISGQH